MRSGRGLAHSHEASTALLMRVTQLPVPDRNAHNSSAHQFCDETRGNVRNDPVCQLTRITHRHASCMSDDR